MPHPISSRGPPLLKIYIRVMLSDPSMSDGVLACASGVWVRFLRNPQPFPPPFLALRVPQPSYTATMIWQGILIAVRLAGIQFPEREAAVYAEAIGVGRNEEVWLCTSHNLTQFLRQLTGLRTK
jgi:hypothetical protein